MDKEELRHQVNDLNEILLEIMEYNPSIVERFIMISRTNSFIRMRLESSIAFRKIKSLNMEDEFIKYCSVFDIHEALNISIIEAKYKLKYFDFSLEEKNKILKRLKCSMNSFIDKQ